MPFAGNVPGAWLVVTLRSVLRTPTTAVLVLLPLTGSPSCVTVAVFEIELGDDGLTATTSASGADAPAAIVPVGRVQEKLDDVVVHVHPVPLTDTKLVPVGRVSATVTGWLFDSVPLLLWTSIV